MESAFAKVPQPVELATQFGHSDPGQQPVGQFRPSANLWFDAS
jgi:hypothetical protein